MSFIRMLARRFQNPLFASLTWALTWAIAFVLFTIVDFFLLSGSVSTLPRITAGGVLLCLAYGALGALSGLACAFLLSPDQEELESLSVVRVAVFGVLASLGVRVLLGKLIALGLVSGVNPALMMDLATHLPRIVWDSLILIVVGGASASGTLQLARIAIADRVLVSEGVSGTGRHILGTGDMRRRTLPR